MSPDEVVGEGDEVTVVLREIDRERRRVRLSMRIEPAERAAAGDSTPD